MLSESVKTGIYLKEKSSRLARHPKYLFFLVKKKNYLKVLTKKKLKVKYFKDEERNLKNKF